MYGEDVFHAKNLIFQQSCVSQSVPHVLLSCWAGLGLRNV